MVEIIILYGLYLIAPNGSIEEQGGVYGYPGSNYVYGMPRELCIEIKDHLNAARIGSRVIFECIPKTIEKKGK